jgi:hypothetical protein
MLKRQGLFADRADFLGAEKKTASVGDVNRFRSATEELIAQPNNGEARHFLQCRASDPRGG